MSAAEPRTPNSERRAKKAPRPMEGWQKRCLFGYWKEVSTGISTDYSESADPERAARLDYAKSKLGIEIDSWSKLTMGQAGKLIKAMRDDLGRNAETGKARPDALEIIARLSLELYGRETWHSALRDRLALRPFFHHAALDQITPRQSHELIEILFDHLERKLFDDGASTDVRKQRKEGLRAHFVRAKDKG